MNLTIDWISSNWQAVIIPGAVFAAALIASFWLRATGYDRVGRWVRKTGWKGDDILVGATRGPSVIWCLLASAYLAVVVSAIPQPWKVPTGRALASLLTASIALTVNGLVRETLNLYGARWKLAPGRLTTAKNAAKVALTILAILTMLDIWGLPMTSILIVVLLVALVAVVVFKDAIADVFAGLQVNATRNIKVGDYVKLSSGEQGHVIEIGTRYAKIHGLDESTTTIPNGKLTQSTVVNYGQPLKKAKEPFRFYGRAQITELTGLKANNLTELVDVLKDVPESVVYYHTHHFLVEHHYLTPEPANDFGVWVADALGDEALGERLASVDTFEFSSLATLKERLVGVMAECLARGGQGRDAPEGREFYFLKSASAIFPTPYVAHDLREFVEALRNVSQDSLYYHVFESRMRLGRGLNDFSNWIEQNLGEKDLADKIAHFDPYTYTLGGLRSTLIQLIEKRIK